MKLTPRHAPWILGLLGLVLLAGLAYERRSGLWLRYRLHELREEPAKLFDYLASDDPHRYDAALRFLAEDPGRELLFEKYLWLFTDSPYHQRALQPLTRPLIAEGYLALGERSYVLGMRGKKRVGYNVASMALPPGDPELRALVLAHLAHLEGHRFQSTLYPGFEFELQRVADERAPGPSWHAAPRPGPRLHGKFERICHFRRVAAARSLASDRARQL